FVAVFVYIGGRREAKGVKWYQCFTTGDTHFTAPNLSDFDSSSLFTLHDRLIDTRPSVARALGDRLIARNSRYPIVIVCTIVLIFAIWGCINMKIDLREEHFLPSAAPARCFLEEYREMFGKTTQFVEIVIEDTVEYDDEQIRDSILEIMDSAVSAGYASRAISWLAEFSKFEKNTIYDINAVSAANNFILFVDSEFELNSIKLMTSYELHFSQYRVMFVLPTAHCSFIVTKMV
ncbi:hypothetical protein COOONC_14786, partial [Cooperia oncophora]